jgi:hypothetical protein
MGSGRDGCGDLGEVQVHRLGVAGRHDQGCTLALLRADCTEDVGGSGPLVPRCAWTGAALGPAAGEILFFWPMRASSANQISIVSRSSAFLRAIASRRAGKFF